MTATDLGDCLAAWLRVPTVHSGLAAKAFWEARYAARRACGTIDRAIDAGLHADRVGLAFTGGYGSALLALVPTLGPGELAALCATEEGGNHPRAIRTRLTEQAGALVLSGSKRFVTFGAAVDALLVFAARGTHADGRPDLCLIRVSPDAPGVSIEPGAPTPFVPEVLHAALALDRVSVRAEQVLAGDGYADYVKPFRTVEDLHVFAAVVAYVLSVGLRYGWPEAAREALVPLLISARALAALEPNVPETHVALAGWLEAGKRGLETLDPHWELVETGERERWYRDRALMAVADRVREARRVAAWANIDRAQGRK